MRSLLRGFVKLEKFKKSEKNLEVGRWVKTELGFFVLGNVMFLFLCVVCYCCTCFQKKRIEWWPGGWVVSGKLGFFFFILDPLHFST